MFDVNELRDRQPINWGLRKMLFWTFVVPIIFYYVGRVMQVLVLNPLAENHLMPTLAYLPLICLYWMIVGFIWIDFAGIVILDKMNKNIFQCWRIIWRNNIWGTLMYSWLDDETGKLECSFEMPVACVSSDEFYVWRSYTGGIRRNKRQVFSAYTRQPIEQWNIKSADGRYYRPYNGYMDVYLIDKHGCKLQAQLIHALKFISNSDNFFNMLLFNYLQYQESNWEAKATALRRLIVEAISRIDNTKRFICSKQGEEIRNWLEEQALDIMP